jgi:hypothetical protein
MKILCKPFARVSMLLMSVMAVTPAFAAEKHQLLGTWTVDVSKLTTPDPPASVTMVLAEAGGGDYTMTIDIVTRDGARLHSGGTFTPGGGTVAVQGSNELDIATFSMPSKNILVMGAALAGHPSHTRVWSLADDGKHMIETIVGHIDGKTPHIRTVFWTRGG